MGLKKTLQFQAKTGVYASIIIRMVHMKKIIKINLLVLLLITPLLSGMKNSSFVLETETVKCSDGSNNLCFKQPATMDDKQLLRHLLHKTKHKRRINQKSLQIAANTVALLCTKNSNLLNTPITADLKYTPLQYASEKCHPHIDDALIKLMGKDKNYTPRSKQAKRVAKVYAQTISSQIITAINNTLSPLAFLAGKEDERIIDGQLTTMNEINKYTWRMRYRRENKRETYFTLIIYKEDSMVCHASGRIKIDRIERKIRLYIESINVEPDYRQYGYGKALLATIRGLAASFKKNTTISLVAVPDDEKMEYILVKYYKDFGFAASNKEDAYMKLYVDKTGACIKTHKIAKYLKKVHDKALCKYITGAKQFAKRIDSFIKKQNNVDRTKREPLKFAIQRAKKISGTIEKLSKTDFSLTISCDNQKYIKVSFSIVDTGNATKKTYLSAKKISRANKTINFLVAKILFELQKIYTVDKSVPVPANIPKDWCTLWGHSVKEELSNEKNN